MKRASYATLTPHGPPGAAPASCARPQRLGPGEGHLARGRRRATAASACVRTRGCGPSEARIVRRAASNAFPTGV
jgi:hypothetical protein